MKYNIIYRIICFFIFYIASDATAEARRLRLANAGCGSAVDRSEESERKPTTRQQRGIYRGNVKSSDSEIVNSELH
jgi:hypothetical protein